MTRSRSGRPSRPFGFSTWLIRSGRRRPGRPVTAPQAAVTESLEQRILLSSVGLTDLPPTVSFFAAGDTQDSAHNTGCTCPGCRFVTDPDTAYAAAVGAPEAAPPFPLSETFKLHSLPGANYTIYLDFDGHTTTGTNWNAAYNNNNAIVSPAYDVDGDAATFSALEQEYIQRIWQRVAEDFAPFNVDVTTEDPGVEKLRKSGGADTDWGIRSIQTRDQSWLTDDIGFAIGGIAYLGSFSWSSDTPCFTFNGSTSTNLFNEMAAADTHSHEVGHTLGLSHDGRSNPVEEYYRGHGTGPTGWAPIMGAGFGQELSQWSKGEYANASQTQDDLAVITDPGLNGAGWGWSGLSYLADLVGNEDFATPAIESTALVLTNGLLGGQGTIERTGDIDSWYFDWNGGLFSIDVKPAERGANLDVLAELLDSTGAVISTSNFVDALDALFDPISLVAGRYFIRVRGTGKAASGSDLGYSNYGSLGNYTIGNAPGVSDDAYEDNDFRALAADPLGNGGEWSGRYLSTINGEGIARDDDWYLINATADFSRIVAQLEFSNAQGDLDLYLYDVRGTLLAVSNGRTGFERIDVIVAAAGAYYLRVAPTGGARGNTYDLYWEDIPTARPYVSVEVSTRQVVEDGSTNLVYTFRRTAGGVGEPITVGFLVSGTARFGTDYTQTGANTFTTGAGSVTIAAGSETAQVVINPLTDAVIESDETVVLTVTEGTGYLPAVLSPIAAVGFILDDDPHNPPVAGNDSASTSEDASVAVAVLGNDTDADGDPLRVLSVDATGLLGTVTINPNGTVTYNPRNAFQYLTTGQTATETFTYVVTDDDGETATGTVTVTINGVTDAPVARPDTGRTRSDRVLPGNVLTNDTDVDGNPLVVSAVNGVPGDVGQQITLPSGAKLTLNADGSYSFDPAGAFDGLGPGQTATVTFTYTVSDGVGGTATGTATITVTNANDAPGAANDAVRINEYAVATGNVLTNDTDADSNPLAVSAVNRSAASVGRTITLASGATVRVNADGTFTYDPNGRFVRLRRGETATDFFSYTVSDGQGGTSTARVTVTIEGGGGEADVVGFDRGKWYVAASDGSSFSTTARAQWNDAPWANLVQGDFDGDGLSDVAGRVGAIWYVGFSTGNSFGKADWGTWNPNAGWRDVLVGDFDGDGKDDIAGRTSDGLWYVSRNVGGTLRAGLFSDWNEAAGWRDVRAIDVDGDGKDDIAGRTSDGYWYVSRSVGLTARRFLFATWNERAGWRDVQVVDINGDGKGDLAGRTSGGQWFVSRGTGAATAAATDLFGTWTESRGWRNVLALDIDGDGRSDIAGRAGNGEWTVLRSTGLSSQSLSFGTWAENRGWRDVVAGDFDGDGRDDIAGRAGNGEWTVLRSTGLASQTLSFGTFDGTTPLLAVAAVDAGTPPIAVPSGAPAKSSAPAPAFAPVKANDDLLAVFWSQKDDALEAGLLAAR